MTQATAIFSSLGNPTLVKILGLKVHGDGVDAAGMSTKLQVLVP